MTLVPPTTKSHRRLGLAVSWRSKSPTPTQKAPMSKRAYPKDRLPPDGAAAALSPSSAFCSDKCPRPADDDAADGLAEHVKVAKRIGKTLTEPETSAELSPPKKTFDKHMPKARNRDAPIAALSLPAMHRKSKCKTKSNTTPGLRSGLMSSNSTFDTSKLKAAQLKSHTHPQRTPVAAKETPEPVIVAAQKHNESSTRINISNKKKANAVRYKMLIPLPTLGATSFVTLLTILCIETVLLSTMSSCAKTFYMHWNTSNSIFRIDNTDHIIDVNKGNLAFEFDQVHIICPVYEPGAFENETEKYIIYNVSKVEYETCRITNADPRVIAICDKPQKLMFFTITFRPFTPQPGGLEFLPGNDYYFISTSSKDDLYRRIGGRCSTNNMKVVFKVCCAPEEKNRTTETTLVGSGTAESGTGSGGKGVDNAVVDLNQNGHNGGNTIGMSGGNSGFLPGGAAGGSGSGSGSGGQLKPGNGMGTSINTNIDQFNRIPIQPNNNIGAGGGGPGSTGGIMQPPGHGSINMLPPGRGGVHMGYPGHHHIQTGIRINNVPTQPNNPHTHHKGNMNVNSNDDHHGYDKHPNEVVKNEELTYNSGSGRVSRSHIWIRATMGLTSMCAYGINLTILLPVMVVIIFNYLLGTRVAALGRRTETLGIYR